MKVLGIVFLCLPQLLLCQQLNDTVMDKLNGTWCKKRVAQTVQNLADSTALLNLVCPDPSVVGKGAFFLCPNNCFQIKKKRLVEGKEPIVLYEILTESGFVVAAFEVNVKHHEKSFVRTHLSPQKTPIRLPEGGSMELNLWEAMVRLKCLSVQ